MQGINSKEHRILLAAFLKFEYLSKMAGEKTEEQEDAETRKAMQELDMLYDRFQVLFAELDKCTKDYELKKKSVRSMINRSIRKVMQRCKVSIVL
jgi:DNA anti-recombination protein RmuC